MGWDTFPFNGVYTIRVIARDNERPGADSERAGNDR